MAARFTRSQDCACTLMDIEKCPTGCVSTMRLSPFIIQHEIIRILNIAVFALSAPCPVIRYLNSWFLSFSSSVTGEDR